MAVLEGVIPFDEDGNLTDDSIMNLGDFRGKFLNRFRSPDFFVDGSLHTYQNMDNIFEHVALNAGRAIRSGRVVDAGIITDDQKVISKAMNVGTTLAKNGLLHRPFQDGWILIGGETVHQRPRDTPDVEFTPVPKTIGMVIFPFDTVEATAAEILKNTDMIVTFYWAGSGPYRIFLDRIFFFDWSLSQVENIPVDEPWMDTMTLGTAHRLLSYTIAAMNTRGIDWQVRPTKLSRKGRIQKTGLIKPRTDYFTALAAHKKVSRTHQGGTHASPIPHVRRGHLRTLPSGEQTWVRDCMVNVPSEGELSFLERRGYKL